MGPRYRELSAVVHFRVLKCAFALNSDCSKPSVDAQFASRAGGGFGWVVRICLPWKLNWGAECQPIKVLQDKFYPELRLYSPTILQCCPM